MNKKLLNIWAAIAIAGSGLMFTSCDLDESNPDQFDAGSFWKNETQFTGNVTAMMNRWRDRFDKQTMFSAGEYRTDYYSPLHGTDGSGLRDLDPPRNNIDPAHPQFSDFANYFLTISDCNTFLHYAETNGSVLSENCREYLLGMVYGMRAYCFFQLHKMYGTAPLRTEADVVLGNYDDLTLQMPRSTAEELLNQIKSDVNASLEHFNAGASYNNSIYKANKGVYYWSKAATEMLAGEVYLWSGKVSTGDHVAKPADVATAKQYFLNVLNNYGYSLAPTFNDAINTKENNPERIFSTFYSVTEYTNNWFNYIMYDVVTGQTPKGVFWNAVEADGTTWSDNASRSTNYYNPITQTETKTEFFDTRMNGQQHYAVKNAYFYQFDREDNRIYTLQPMYLPTQDELDNNVRYVENFNPENYHLAGCYVWKYHGLMGNQGVMVAANDMMYYRLALVYTYLAEIANYEGSNSDVEKYLNAIRKRAYGDNWDEARFAYRAGSFLENEVAILQEKTKEFFQEGQRWWDLRRMTAVKDGSDADHLIFRPEGCIGYGLDVASHPMWNEISGNLDQLASCLVVETNKPVLDYATQKHLVLWPLDNNLLTDDPKLKQTPGYEAPSAEQDGGPWIEH